MSQLKPSININPAFATNGLDNNQAGFYQIAPNSSNLAVRVSYSNIAMAGEIRLNTTVGPAKFQGYTGLTWVDFDASTGPQGPPGKDFTNAVNFLNGVSAPDPSNITSQAQIFATTYANVAANVSNVVIRSLEAGDYIVNSNLTIQTAQLSQNSNVITIIGKPLPYKWDFGLGNQSHEYLKNASGDSPFFGWGETSRWVVKSGSSVVKGQAVRITNDGANVAIIPVEYSSLTGISPLTTPFNMLGIACETAAGGSNCLVCSKGITTVLCTSNITADFVSSSSVSAVGIDGLVGRDGGIFCNTTPMPLVCYIRAGYFLESGLNVAGAGNYALFYVEPRVQVV